jgi:hypothetical protein
MANCELHVFASNLDKQALLRWQAQGLTMSDGEAHVASSVLTHYEWSRNCRPTTVFALRETHLR